ncbi:GerW family sporulation protein [Oceanobacillus rekensis]|uniref:GerW family sporulation protein n=1 Tax=Oceanobacillus rekensis TaxID=937927 RepID=UPI000B4373C5|nr:GerW family sporulation protein [Oceanobacillus rekensis]
MTDEHPIEGLMTTAMENLQKMVEVNTIIGDPVKSPDGSLIIPVSKLGFGFAAGGSEFNSNQSQGDSNATLPFGGGSGGGVSITPVAFLIVSEQGIKMVHLDQNTHLYEKMIDFAPQVIEKVQQIIKESGGSRKEEKKEKSEKSNPSQYDI